MERWFGLLLECLSLGLFKLTKCKDDAWIGRQADSGLTKRVEHVCTANASLWNPAQSLIKVVGRVRSWHGAWNSGKRVFEGDLQIRYIIWGHRINHGRDSSILQSYWWIRNSIKGNEWNSQNHTSPSLADRYSKGLMRSPFKRKVVALKSAVACCLTYLLATGTLQCQRNAFPQETYLNWFGLLYMSGSF